ncbi:hypothetical protein ILUMI_05529 [Ignelater luminosus]|uniref:Uncharacterized protein n=1 Tax=Ignelater luminosus TaxID=2038154 RepID=A0A8K0D6Y1_IGNLU|nr:hypothetical protein ILUMI_05529 [Ignelater luminosus]
MLNPLSSMEKLFFALFGQAKNYDLMTTNPKGPLLYRPDWTKTLFKIVFAVYMLLTVVVLLKLLIATMSDTYKQFQAQSDTEWKFGLSKLIRTIDLTTTAPSPINLITTWLCYLIDLCRAKARKMHDQPMSPRSKAGSKWISKLKRESDATRRASVAASLVMNLNSSFDSKVAYNIQTRYIEYVINWPSIVKKYRALKELNELNENEESDEESEEGSEKGS